MEEKLHQIKNSAIPMILEAANEKDLEEVYLQFLGKNGIFTLAVKEIAKVPKEKRPEFGKVANEVKMALEDAVSEKKQGLHVTTKQKIHKFDVTDPGILPPLGHLHLTTQGIEEITTIFQNIGFNRVRYPEVEWDWYAFEALNFPENHPARDDWETFFIQEAPDKEKGPMLLTPHTSSGQIRQMETGELPIRMLNIAKCYRRQSDVSHAAMFHQFEGLVVDRGINITHLKGTLDYFVKAWFGPDRVSRIRPYQFQFTEPSFEVDVSCGVCRGKGVLPNGEKCRLCKAGWLEMGGSGMVHPNVLRNCGIDPEVYTGFAFGWGVERVIMMKEGLEIDDLRLLYANNLEFLEQF